MPLISCPECKKEISDQAKTCPNCGYPISGDTKQPKVPSKKTRILLLIIPLIIIIAGAGIYFAIQYNNEQELNNNIKTVMALISQGDVTKAKEQIGQLSLKGYPSQKINDLNNQLKQYCIDKDKKYLSDAQNSIKNGDYVIAKNSLSKMQGFIDNTEVQKEINLAILDETNKGIQLVNKMLSDCLNYTQEYSEIYNDALMGNYSTSKANEKLTALYATSANAVAITSDNISLNDTIDRCKKTFPRNIIGDDFLELYDLYLTLLNDANTFCSQARNTIMTNPSGASTSVLSIQGTLSKVSEAASNLKSKTYAKYNK